MYENEEVKKEIFEYLDTVFPTISTRDELWDDFKNELNLYDCSQDNPTTDGEPDWNSIRFQCREDDCSFLFYKYSKEMFSPDGEKIKSVGERFGK
jgi:hypothetical protein